MLSYLRNNAIPETKQQQDQANQEGYISPAAGAKNVRQTSMLLAGLFVIGMFSVFVMIKKAAVPQQAAAAKDAQIEAGLAQFAGIKKDMFSQMDQIVQKFHDFSNFEQIKPTELARDPFYSRLAISAQVMRDLNRQAAGDANAVESVLFTRVRELQIQSIMNSQDKPCCMINDKLLYVGDKIEDFTIAAIGGNFVEFKAGQFSTVLKLSEE